MQEDVRIAAADSVGAMVDALVQWLRLIDGEGESAREQLTVLGDLERLSNAASAAQVRVTAAFAEDRRQQGASARGVAADVAFARRVGLSKGQRLVAAARTLVDDLPETMAALESGELSGARAIMVAEGVAPLEPAAREVVDDSLAGSLTELGDGEVREAVATAAATVDPELVERRRRAALGDRRVTVRSAADGMAWLGIFTTMAEAAEAEATLRRHALGLHAEARIEAGLGVDGTAPDRQSLAGHMADTAIARLTGREVHRGPLVEIQIVASEATLFGEPGTPGRERPARIVGIGSIPAEAAREMVRPRSESVGDGRAFGLVPADPLAEVRDVEHEARRVTVRRLAVGADGRDLLRLERHRRFLPPDIRAALLTAARPVRPAGDDPPDRSAAGGAHAPRRPDPGPDPGDLEMWRRFLGHPPDPSECVELSSTGRLYVGGLRQFILLRDHVCRAPWCSARVRHVDHARRHCEGGATDSVNGNGDCVGHNLAKEDAGWVVVPCAATGTDRDGPHILTWRSPTGLTYTSTAPPLFGWGCPAAPLADDETTTTEFADSPLEAGLATLLAA